MRSTGDYLHLGGGRPLRRWWPAGGRPGVRYWPAGACTPPSVAKRRAHKLSHYFAPPGLDAPHVSDHPSGPDAPTSAVSDVVSALEFTSVVLSPDLDLRCSDSPLLEVPVLDLDLRCSDSPLLEVPVLDFAPHCHELPSHEAFDLVPRSLAAAPVLDVAPHCYDPPSTETRAGPVIHLDDLPEGVRADGLSGYSVILDGLKNCSELNGRRGVVEGYDSAKQRWIVDLGPASGKKLLRGANLVPTDEGLASDYDSADEAEEEESDDQTKHGLHYEEWCTESFEIFVTPTALPCSYCKKKVCIGTKFGICEACRAMVCYNCIENARHV